MPRQQNATGTNPTLPRNLSSAPLASLTAVIIDAVLQNNPIIDHFDIYELANTINGSSGFDPQETMNGLRRALQASDEMGQRLRSAYERGEDPGRSRVERLMGNCADLEPIAETGYPPFDPFDHAEEEAGVGEDPAANAEAEYSPSPLSPQHPFDNMRARFEASHLPIAQDLAISSFNLDVSIMHLVTQGNPVLSQGAIYAIVTRLTGSPSGPAATMQRLWMILDLDVDGSTRAAAMSGELGRSRILRVLNGMISLD